MTNTHRSRLRFPDKLRQFFGYKFSLFAFFYFLISYAAGFDGTELLINGAVLFTAFALVGFFGYFSNDMADREADAKAGKKNMAAALPLWACVSVAAGTALAGTALIVWRNPAVWPWMSAEVVLLLLYSFPPVRLKERGLWGILADALYAYGIPAVVLLVYLDSSAGVNPVYFYFFPAFYLLLGLKNILRHQLDDVDNDRISGTRTLATDRPETAERLAEVGLWLSVLCWTSGFACLFADTGHLLYLAVGVAVFAVSVFKGILAGVYREKRFMSGMPESEIILYGFCIFWIAVTWHKDWVYLCSLVFVFSPPLFNKSDKVNRIASVFFLFYLFLKKVYWWVYRALSFVVNYGLYYTFLLFGVNLKERAAQKAAVRKAETGFVTGPVPEASLRVIPLREKNVHALWIGKRLSSMELLCIRSFLAHGYEFHLWVYEPLDNELPEACRLMDANEIIPSEKIFRYRYASQFGVGKGSVSGFSDIFRYKLLHDRGGWWVDMDVTCLKPFDVEAPYFFRAHHDLPLVGNIMKCPKGSPLMWRCYEEASARIDENNRDWHKPIQILVDNVKAFGLEKYVLEGVSNTDEWHKLKRYVSAVHPFPEEWYFIHWCNEVWRTNGYSKDRVIHDSSYGLQLAAYGLLPSLPEPQRKKHDRRLRRKEFFEKLLPWI